jgi:haloacetate dehalogenase
MTDLFPEFDDRFVESGGVSIRVRSGGSGAPLLLLHGHPQTHVMWHRITPMLANDFKVVLADLPGYGDSSAPESAPDHSPYTKRAMAQILVDIMANLGHRTFMIAGHDRGGRCAYRMALDFPDRVEKLATLDIIPTGEAFRRITVEFAHEYWHWFFLSQPAPIPEEMIAANPEAYYFRGDRSIHDPAALGEYLRCVHNPATVHAMCEDYRAAIGFDRELDDADSAVGLKVQCPVLVLWAEHNHLGGWYDVLEVWRGWASDVRGSSIPSGHYMAEERPVETYNALAEFFGQ